MTELRIAIVGTRPPDGRRYDPDPIQDRRDWSVISTHCRAHLYELLREHGRFTVVSGGAFGIDSIAEEFARKERLSRTIITPDYDAFRGREKLAPLSRNGLIVAACDLMHAWPKRSRGGTDDAIEKMERAIAKGEKRPGTLVVHRPWEAP